MRRSQLAITVQAVHGSDVLEITITNNTEQKIKMKSICLELSDGSPLYVVDRWCKMSTAVNPTKRGSFINQNRQVGGGRWLGPLDILHSGW